MELEKAIVNAELKLDELKEKAYTYNLLQKKINKAIRFILKNYDFENMSEETPYAEKDIKKILDILMGE